MANSVNPDETAHYEPSHLDLHYLQRYLIWSAGLKGKMSLFTFLFKRKQLKLNRNVHTEGWRGGGGVRAEGGSEC